MLLWGTAQPVQKMLRLVSDTDDRLSERVRAMGAIGRQPARSWQWKRCGGDCIDPDHVSVRDERVSQHASSKCPGMPEVVNIDGEPWLIERW